MTLEMEIHMQMAEDFLPSTEKASVAFPGLSTQAPQPHSVAGHFLPLTDTYVGKGLGAELALKKTVSTS